jgi:hypothetical protein
MKQFVKTNVSKNGTLIEELTIFDDCTYCPSLSFCFYRSNFSEKAKDCPCSICLVKPMCKIDCNDKRTHDRLAILAK